MAPRRIKDPTVFGYGKNRGRLFIASSAESEKLSLPHSRPMPGIGARCHELWIVDETKNWRVIYRIDSDAIVVLDVFQKKTKETPKYVIDKCKRRIKEYDS